MSVLSPEAPTTAVVETPTQRDLVRDTDRCDRCGAEAFVRAELPAGQLLLCGHHFTARPAKDEPTNEEVLRQVAVKISDQRAFINAKNASSA